MVTTETKYDSKPDTMAHICRVSELIAKCQMNLSERAVLHDESKLQEPEKSGYNEATTRLKGLTYGSEAYKAALAELKPTLDHHYAANSHHPEHVPLFRCAVCKSILRESETWVVNLNDTNNPRVCSKCCPASPIYECEAVPYIGVEGMSLFDLLEMLMDWKAATERMAGGGDIRRSLEINRTRFNLSPQLESILANTINEMGW